MTPSTSFGILDVTFRMKSSGGYQDSAFSTMSVMTIPFNDFQEQSIPVMKSVDFIARRTIYIRFISTRVGHLEEEVPIRAQNTLYDLQSPQLP